MNVDDAKQIINLFAIHLDLTQKKSLREQLREKFVPTFWGSGLLLKESRKGRLYSFLNGKSSSIDRELKINSIALRAIKTLREELETYQQIPWDLRFRMQTELLTEVEVLTPTLSPEFKELEKEVREEEMRKAQTKRPDLSLLRFPPLGTIDLKAFNEIFQSEFEFNDMSLNYIKTFLDTIDPTKAFCVENYEERLEFLRKGLRQDRALKEAFFPSTHALASQQRQQLMKKKALDLSIEVQRLSPGESTLLCGSYGQKIVTYETVFRLLQLLPQSALKAMPPSLAPLLKLDEVSFPDPNKFVEDYIHKTFQGWKLTLSQHIPNLNIGNFIPFFEDTSGDLPEGIKSHLPNYINELFRRGLLRNWASVFQLMPPKEIFEPVALVAYNAELSPGEHAGVPFGRIGDLFNIAGMIPSSTLGAILDWVGKNGNNLESIITSQAKEPIKAATAFLNQQIRVLFENIRKVVPNYLMEMLGLDFVFTSGILWYEFKKEDPETYTLLIYSSGPALKKHSVGKAGEIQWPLRIEGIKQENLTTDFFQRILFHHIETQFDISTVSRAEDIFEGVISSLGGHVVQDASNWRRLDLDNEMNWEGVLNICTKSQAPKGLMQLKFQVEGLQRLSHHYTKNGALVLTDSGICQVLRKAVMDISERLEKIKSTLPSQQLDQFMGHADFAERFKHTSVEINDAIEKYTEEAYRAKTALEANPLHLPEGFVLKIRQLMKKGGITDDDIRSVKTTLCWAMGNQEIGEFVDAFANTVGSDHFNQDSLPMPSQGWLRDLFASAYYRITITALKTVISLAKIHQSQYSPLLIAQGLHTGLSYVLPQPYYDWYIQIVVSARNKLMEIFGKIVLRCIFSKEDYARILALGRSWSKVIHLGIQAVSEQQSINFDQGVQPHIKPYKVKVELPAPLEKMTVTTTQAVSLTDQSYQDLLRNLKIVPQNDLKAESVLENLRAWNEDCAKISSHPKFLPEDLLIHLLNQIDQFPIPSEYGRNVWKRINRDHIEACIDELNSLSLKLADAYKKLSHEGYYKQMKYGPVVIAVYTILAIIHTLAKREPKANLDGYQVNGYEIYFWLKSNIAVLENPDDRARLAKVLSYFLPNFNFSSPVDEGTISKEMSGSLFYYGFLAESSVVQTIKSWHLIRITTLDSATEKVAEFRYLSDFVKNGVQRQAILGHALTEDKFKTILCEEGLENYCSDRLVDIIWKRWNEMTELDIRLEAKDPLRKFLAHSFEPQANTLFFRRLLILNLLNVNNLQNLVHKLYEKVDPEMEEFLEILSKKTYKDYLPKLKQAIDSVLYNHEITEIEQVDILLTLSNHPGLDNQILPRAYLHLRMQTLLANTLVHEGLAFKGFQSDVNLPTLWAQDNEIVSCAAFPYLFVKKPLHHTPKRIFERGHFDSKFPTPSAYRYTKEASKIYFADPSSALITSLAEETQRTQSAIIYAPVKIEPKITRSSFESQSLEMIFIEPSDRIVRFLDFFRLHFDYASSSKEVRKSFFQLFYTVMYDLKNLDSQFKQYPQFLSSIGEFFKDAIKFHRSRKNIYPCFWLTLEGLKILKLCKGNTSTYSHKILALLETLEAVCNSKQRVIFLCLQALFYHHTNDQLHERFYIDILFALFNLKQDFDAEVNEYSDLVDPILYDFKEMLSQHRAGILRALKRDEFRQAVIAKLLQAFKIAIEPEKFVLDQGWVYRYQLWSIDFFEGTIRERDQSITTKIQQLQSFVRSLKIVEDESVVLHLTPEQRFVDYQNKLQIETTDQDENIHLRVTKEFDHVRYLFMPNPPKELQESLEKFQGFKLEGTCTYWVEETNLSQKRLLIRHENRNHLFAVEVFLTKPQEFFLTGLYEGNQRIVQYEPVLFYSIIGALKRFCPSSEVLCWANSSTGQLHRISFKPYQLEFQAERSADTLKLVNDRHLGYWIAKTQFHSSLRGIPSYLLLEDENNQKRVLVPSDQWVSMLVMKFMQPLGPVSNLAGDFLSYFNSPKNASLFVYDIDSKGNLVSDDHQALVYLILIFLVLGKERECLAATKHLKLLGKQKKFDESVYNLLKIILLTPFNINGVAKIRQSLCALYEENLLKHLSADATQAAKTAGQLQIDLGIAFVTLIDLVAIQKTNDYKRVSEFEEYFLFRSYLRRILNFVQTNMSLSDKVKQIVDHLGWETVLELLALTPDLTARYQVLNKKFGIDNSIFAKPYEYAVKTVSGPSILPDMSHIVGQLIPIHELVSEADRADMIAFFRTMSSHFLFDGTILKIPLLKESIQQELRHDVILNICDLTPEIFITDFMTYYAIARDEYLHNQRPALEKMLPLLKGGWNKQTELLVLYLRFIFDSPRSFPKTEELSKALRVSVGLTCNEQQVNVPLEKFFEEVRKKCLQLTALAQSKAAAPKVVGMLLQALAPRRILATVLPTNYLNWAGKAIHALVSPTKSVRRDAPVQSSAEYYVHLSDFDEKIDLELKAAFDMLFQASKDKREKAKKKVTPFDVDDPDPVVAAQFCQLNASLREYYISDNDNDTLWKFNGVESLLPAYETLSLMQKKLKQQITDELQVFLELLNASKWKNGDTLITLEDLYRCFIKDDYSLIEGFARKKEILLIEEIISRHLASYSRLQQVERGMSALQRIVERLSRNSEADIFVELEAVIEVLLAQRVYKFTKTSAKIAKHLLIFEVCTKKLVWEKQFLALDSLQGEISALIELLMGSGKTFFIIPTIDSIISTRKRVACNLWTTEMLQTNLRQIAQQGSEIFHQMANLLRFNRTANLKLSNLNAILVILHRALESGESINMTPEDAQALDLIFLDRFYTYRHDRNGGSDYQIRWLLKYREILRFFRTHVRVVGDEAHKLLDQKKQQLNYPVGSSTVIQKSYYLIMEQCIRHLFSDKRITKLICENNLIALSSYDEIFDRVANKMASYPLFKVKHENTREFVGYVTGKASEVPPWIALSPHYKEICMLKGVLTKLFPLVLSKTVNVDYGSSMHQNNGEQARPYQGNTSPLEQASIRNPYEATVKTMFTFLVNGLSIPQAKKLIEFLLKKAMDSSAHHQGQALENNVYYKRLLAWLPGHRFIGEDLESLAKKLVSHIDEETRFDSILCYVRFFVRSQIRYWKKNICSDSQNLNSIFEAAYYGTGTPYNSGMYPGNLKMLLDSTTLGQALHLINARCPSDGLHILDNEQPRKILEEILTRFFRQKHQDFGALIDGGALFKGMTPIQVASGMLEFAQKYRPDIQAIVFFDKTVSPEDPLISEDVLVYLEKGATRPQPFDRCTIHPKARWAYYDQHHGFAADIPVLNNALVLFGLGHMLYAFLQQGFRLRGLLKRERLAQDQSQSASQAIHFAMPSFVKEKIVGSDKLTLIEMFKYAAKNESLPAALNNYFAYCAKIRNHVRRALLVKMCDAKTSFEEMEKLFQAYEEDVFVTRFEDDPEKLWGFIETKVATQKVVKAVRDQTYKLVEGRGLLTSEELKEINQSIQEEPEPLMPREVSAMIKGSELVALNDGLGQEVNHHEVDNTQDVEEMENEVSAEQEQELKTNDEIQQSKSKFQEWKWPRDLPSHDLTWIVPELIVKAGSQSTFGDFASKFLNKASSYRNIPPPLLFLQDLLESSKLPFLNKIAPLFDKRIWFSNNFLPTRVKGFFDAPIEVGSKEQRELLQVLVHLELTDQGANILYVGCLSIQDAAFWSTRLQDLKPNKERPDLRVVLFDVVSRKVVAGDSLEESQPAINLRKDPAFLRILVQLQYLNGNVVYHKTQHRFLKEWLQSSPNLLIESFEQIHINRGREEPIAESDFDIITKELIGSTNDFI
jgi:hypothetical protein